MPRGCEPGARTGRRGQRAGRALAISLAAGLLLTAAPGLPGVTGTAMAQRMIQIGSAKRSAAVVVPVGKSEDVRTDAPFTDIVVGKPGVADVSALTDHTLSILGRKIGTTRVSIYGQDRKLIGVFDVEVSYDVTTLAIELARRFPTSKLRVQSVNGRILLSGTATDGIVLDQALTVARQFGPEVINSVQVMQPQQVMLEVRFVEASRQAGRELGVQWNVTPRPGHAESFISNIGANRPASSLPITPTFGDLPISSLTTPTNIPAAAAGVIGTATNPFGFIAGNMIAKGLNIEVAPNALEERGLARRLAEPNLVALSGDTANFLAGGEYPIPVPGAFAGSIVVDYKKYGISLAFTPTVLNGSVINLKIEPEVSQLDPSHAVTVGNGIVVPALTVRRASSTIELRDGQSFVLAGLLANELSTAQQQLPWIGDVPG